MVHLVCILLLRLHQVYQITTLFFSPRYPYSKHCNWFLITDKTRTVEHSRFIFLSSNSALSFTRTSNSLVFGVCCRNVVNVAQIITYSVFCFWKHQWPWGLLFAVVLSEFFLSSLAIHIYYLISSILYPVVFKPTVDCRLVGLNVLVFILQFYPLFSLFVCIYLFTLFSFRLVIVLTLGNIRFSLLFCFLLLFILTEVW